MRYNKNWMIMFSVLPICAMKKNQCLTDLDFAKVSAYVYQEGNKQNPLAKKGYTPFMSDKAIKKGIGFKGIALRNEHEKKVVIGYRGTEVQNLDNLFVDIGIFCLDEQGNPYETLFDQLGNWLERYDTSWYLTFWIASLIISQEKTYKKALEDYLNKLGHEFHIDENMKWYTHQGIDAALDFYKKVKAKAGSGYKIYSTGHSSGGGYAQMVGGAFKVPTVTFNAPGVMPIFQKHFKDKGFFFDNIRNIYRSNDVVGMFGTHVGQPVQYYRFEKGPGRTRPPHEIFEKTPVLQYMLKSHAIEYLVEDLKSKEQE